jgi:hypothetical protein
MGAADDTCVGTMTVVEAKALVAGVTERIRGATPVQRATTTTLNVFINSPRKEFAQYPLGASFHSSTDSPQFHSEVRNPALDQRSWSGESVEIATFWSSRR